MCLKSTDIYKYIYTYTQYTIYCIIFFFQPNNMHIQVMHVHWELPVFVNDMYSMDRHTDGFFFYIHITYTDFYVHTHKHKSSTQTHTFAHSHSCIQTKLFVLIVFVHKEVSICMQFLRQQCYLHSLVLTYTYYASIYTYTDVRAHLQGQTSECI